ncbi:MAG: hypothetical protein ACRDN1_07390 [Trebonia sp.]
MSDPRAPSDLSERELAFCGASIRDWHGRAARMLAANPEIAGYGFATAVVLGDATRVREAITPRSGGRDPPRRPHRVDTAARGVRVALAPPGSRQGPWAGGSGTAAA